MVSWLLLVYHTDLTERISYVVPYTGVAVHYLYLGVKKAGV
jgi:hypothetical protein